MCEQVEFERFKREIDLCAYLENAGYSPDNQESYAGTKIMRRRGDKISVSRRENGHWVYFSFRDYSDNGTIIDFVEKHQGLSNLGGVRKVLRAWLGLTREPTLPVPRTGQQPVKDRARILANYNNMRPVPPCLYLEVTRKIPVEVLAMWRFQDRVRQGPYGSAVFPHFDAEGICGYEMKGSSYTGFAKGGLKGLWISNCLSTDRVMVICESGIEALSHATLYPSQDTRYVSVSGEMSIRQHDLLKRAILEMPDESQIVSAMNADEFGKKLDALVEWLFGEALSGKRFALFQSQWPVGFKDWNEQLCAKEGTDGVVAGE